MKKELVSIAPLRAGIIRGVLYGAVSLIALPFILLGILLGHKAGGGSAVIVGVAMVIFIPVVYATLGFIGGVIAAAVYNLIAQWTGGIEFEVRDSAPSV